MACGFAPLNPGLPESRHQVPTFRQRCRPASLQRPDSPRVPFVAGVGPFVRGRATQPSPMRAASPWRPSGSRGSGHFWRRIARSARPEPTRTMDSRCGAVEVVVSPGAALPETSSRASVRDDSQVPDRRVSRSVPRAGDGAALNLRLGPSQARVADGRRVARAYHADATNRARPESLRGVSCPGPPAWKRRT
jgi:hypothetical protein